MEQKEGTRVNRRLLIGLIVSLLLLAAAGVAGGVAFSGVLWYQEQMDGLTESNRQTVEELQKRLEELQKRLEETEAQLAQAREKQAAAEEKAAEIDGLQRQIDSLTAQLEEARKGLAAAGVKAAFPKDAKLVALTFDDGPGKTTTPRLLDELKRRGVRATFFVLGVNAARYPDLLKRMDAEGHAIASHSWSHKNLTTLSDDALQQELDRCAGAVRQAVGYAPSLLRPPGGNFDARVLAAVKAKGLSVVNWSVDTKDWKSREKTAVVEAAFQKGMYGVQNGSIVLMHDVYDSTVEAAVEIVDRLLSDQYILVTVPELLQARAGGAVPGRVYYSSSRFKDAV